MPFVSLAGAVVIVEPVKNWVFKTPHTDRMACEKIFVDMRARGIERIALISGPGGFDKSMRAECLKIAKKHGIQVVADETYGAGDTDMTAQLTKIKNTPGVQAVLNAGFGQGPAIVTKNFRQVGAQRAALPVAWRGLEGVHQARRRRRRGRAPAGRGAARGRGPAGQRPAEEGRGGLQARLRGQVQERGLDLRRTRVRRADAGGGGAEQGRAAPTRPRSATRSRASAATWAPPASSTCRRPTTWASISPRSGCSRCARATGFW